MFAAFRHHHSWRLSRPTAGIRRLSSVVHIPWPLGTLLAFSVVLRSHADQAGLRPLCQPNGDYILDAATCMTILRGRNIMQVHM